jgi:hypothetical protein
MKDKKMFNKYMSILAEIHGKDLSAALLEAYWLILKSYSDSECETAFNRMMVESRFFPKPADIIESITKASPCVQDAAQDQVNVVMRQIRDLGSYRTPVFDDPITKSLMSSRWSWQSVCSMTESELKWWAKEFIDAYQSANHSGTLPQIESNSSRLRLLAGGIGK